jgi:hypothetical protein
LNYYPSYPNKIIHHIPAPNNLLNSPSSKDPFSIELSMATEVVRESKILLTNDNYALWLLPMKAKLHKAKSLTIVTGLHVCPDPEKDKDNA